MGMTTRQIFKDGAVAAGIVISFLAFLILTFRLLCVIGREHAINALREAAKEHVADLLAAYLENHKLRTVAVQAALVRERLEKGYRADITPLSQALDEILIVVDHSINTNGATMGVKPFIVN
jgi:Na+-transporting methylmalonyl-CoA/oxaloacetate decarboxylase gamma subunit